MKKKILSIVLACALVFGVIGSASAANGQIMPLSTQYSDVIRGGAGATQYDGENIIHTKQGDGTYLRVWFENYQPSPCTLYLYSEDFGEQLASVKIPARPENADPNDQYGDFLVYRCPNQDMTYCIRIQMNYQVPGSSSTVYGYLAATQNISI